MGIFKRIATPTKRALRDLFADTDLAVTVVYKKYSGQGEFDRSLGYAPDTYTNYSDIKAIRLRHTKKSAEASQSKVEAGDEVFMFQSEDMPYGMSLKDLIVDEDGNEIGIAAIDNIFNIAISVTSKGAKSIEGGGE